ncbi:sensor domain-containing diguanylate cyclase [Williamsia deligens]
MAAFEASTVPMALADEEGLLTAANSAYCAMVGRPWSDIAGMSSRAFTHPDDIAQHRAMAQLMDAAASRGEALRVEKRYVHPDGSVRWGWVSASPVTGPQGQVWTMAVIHDTTDRRRAEESLMVAATTDPLTGLMNRRGWEDLLTRFEQPPARSQDVALAIVDLDRFKTYNDTFGHAAGDQLLVDFARDATTAVGNRAVLARWGGEEFAVALPDSDDESARQVLDELAAVVPDGQTFCAGLTVRRPDEATVDCFRRADALLYQAKRSGRGRVVTG